MLNLKKIFTGIFIIGIIAIGFNLTIKNINTNENGGSTNISNDIVEKINDNSMIAKEDEENDTLDNDTIMEEEHDVIQGSAMESGSIKKESEDSNNGTTSFTISGTILAGKTSPLIDFNPDDYEKALATGKPLVLYFYADWCPVCKKEQPALFSTFNNRDDSRIIGFRINFNDNCTDNDEKNLAKEHGVAYQHTKVFIKDGKRVLKSPETWSEQRYEAEIQSNLL